MRKAKGLIALAASVAVIGLMAARNNPAGTTTDSEPPIAIQYGKN